jgi:hypothetical protein
MVISYIYSTCWHMKSVFYRCQHLPPVPLHPTVLSWPFGASGIDVIGAIEPPSTRGHHIILVAIAYFSKWAEAIPLREVSSDNVINFLERQIIYRFGVPC